MGAEVNRVDSSGSIVPYASDKTGGSGLGVDDFLTLMVAQMQNQDFMDPMDDTQFISQMAQFSTMQEMQRLAAYSESNYAISLVGKTVTASRIDSRGNLDTVTDVVTSISLVDNEYVISVGGKQYTLGQIMSVSTAPATKPPDKDDGDGGAEKPDDTQTPPDDSPEKS